MVKETLNRGPVARDIRASEILDYACGAASGDVLEHRSRRLCGRSRCDRQKLLDFSKTKTMLTTMITRSVSALHTKDAPGPEFMGRGRFPDLRCVRAVHRIVWLILHRFVQIKMKWVCPCWSEE